MKLMSVNCNHCGAPLQVAEAARFVTCGYCETQLSVEHSGSAVYTQVLEEIRQTTEKLEQDVASLKRSSVVEQLDREWMIEREKYMVSTQNGGREIPSAGGSIVGGVVAVVFGIFWTIMVSSMGAPGFFPLFGLLFIGAGIFSMFAHVGKAGDYRAAEARYQRRRRELMR